MAADRKLKLVSFAICPFVQRSAIALEARGEDYEIEYIDLRNKPEWFLKMSPLGKVPVLQVQQGDRSEVLYESQVINEYLDETAEASMHPADPLDRAKHRARIELISQTLGPAWVITQAKDESEAREHAATIKERIARFESELGAGPFFAGEQLHLIDTAAGPLMQRLTWTERVFDFGFFEGLPKVSAWRDALLAHPAVGRSTVDDVEQRFRAALGGFLAERRDQM